MSNMARRVAVIGSGYVGTVVAACLAYIGHRVVGVEADRSKLALLCKGKAPFYEENLDDLLVSGLQAGQLRFTSEVGEAIEECEFTFICVGTPQRPDGKADMSAMEEVARVVAPHLRRPHIFINKSTVPIGSGRWLSSVIAEAAGDPKVGSLVRVVSNPEFLREGTAVTDYLRPDRVVVGADDPGALEEVVALYQPVLDQSFAGPGSTGIVPLVRTDLMTAEMVKYAANAFLATKISFANEIARFCELVGADVQTVTAGIGLDRRIGPRFLNAGLGFGGSCFTKDLAAMVATAGEYGYKARLLEAVMGINSDQRHLVIEKLLRHLKNLRGARVALLGLSYKPGTDDLRDSPGLDIARRLMERGAFVAAYDPVVKELPAGAGVRVAKDVYAAALEAEALVVATDWPEFLDLDWRRVRATMRGALLLDGRNCLDPSVLAEAGFVYEGIGRLVVRGTAKDKAA
jgi:nucleotide sugar dehydrogenase